MGKTVVRGQHEITYLQDNYGDPWKWILSPRQVPNCQSHKYRLEISLSIDSTKHFHRRWSLL